MKYIRACNAETCVQNITYLYRCILPAGNAKVKLQTKTLIQNMRNMRCQGKITKRIFGLVDDRLFNQQLQIKTYVQNTKLMQC